MSRKPKPKYKIVGPDIDLETDIILDSDGRRIDQAYVDEVMVEANAFFDRYVGRPSLTGKPAHSPHVSFRVTPELKARAELAARERGTTVSQLAREAFERYLAS